MKVQIASDLHIEYLESYNEFIKPSGDILILAGDIGSLYQYDKLKKYIHDLSKLYKIILYVPGNHEYYTIKNVPALPLKVLHKRLYNIEKEIDNLYILNRSSIKIQNYCFIGCTLWSKIPDKTKFPFYRVRIKGFNNYIYNKNNSNDITYIQNMIEYCQENNLKPIVVTHYPPSLKCLKKRSDNLNFLYANDLEYLIKQVPIWICGHVHWNFRMKFGESSMLISNQKGRKSDKVDDYKNNFIINI